MGKLTSFLNSPKGQKVAGQVTRKAQQMASDPNTRRKIDSGLAQVQKRFKKNPPR